MAEGASLRCAAIGGQVMVGVVQGTGGDVEEGRVLVVLGTVEHLLL